MVRLIILFLVLVSLKAFAQPQTNLSAFPYAMLLYNPAYAGAEDHINLSLINKSQWKAQPGNPVYHGLTADMPINYERIGIGVNLSNETAGIVQTLYFNGNFSYKINLSKGRLAFGIRAGIKQRTEKMSDLLVKDQSDPLLADTRELVPEFGGGVFYKEKKYYVGLSFTRSTGVYLEQNATLKNYYYVMAGSNYKLSSQFVFKPAVMVKYTQSFTPYASVILPFEFDHLLSLGVGYSTASVFSVQSTLHLDKLLGSLGNRYSITYAYDQSFNKLNNYIGNTHELILTVKLVPAEKLDRILKRKVTVSPLLFD